MLLSFSNFDRVGDRKSNQENHNSGGNQMLSRDKNQTWKTGTHNKEHTITKITHIK